jgi:hypothetical protein
MCSGAFHGPSYGLDAELKDKMDSKYDVAMEQDIRYPNVARLWCGTTATATLKFYLADISDWLTRAGMCAPPQGLDGQQGCARRW